MAMSMSDAREWAKTASVGEYLVEYADDGLDEMSDPDRAVDSAMTSWPS